MLSFRKILILNMFCMCLFVFTSTFTSCCRKKSGCPANTAIAKNPMDAKKYKTTSGVIPKSTKKKKKK